MSKNEYIEKYNKNKEVLDKLNILLEKNENGNYDEFSKETIISAIKEIEKEQEFYINQIRKNMYSKYKKKMNSFRKNALIQPEFIDNGDEIIIQANSIDEYVSDVEENNEDIFKDDAPTEILTSDDAETEVLKSNIIEFKDAKIVFDGSYKLIYDGGKEFVEPISDILLEYNSNSKESSNNVNIVRMLEKFDEINNSNLCERYKNNDIEVCYDLKKLSKTKEDKILAKNIEKIAKKEAKTNNKVIINKENKLNRIKAGITATIAASLLLIGGLQIGKLSKNKTVDDFNNTYTESTTEEKQEETTVSNVEVDTREYENLTTDKETEVKEKEEIQEEAILEPEETDIKIGDTIELENTDLYYSSTDQSPKGNTNKLKGYNYKATTISVVYENKVMELVYNDSISLSELEKVCKEKYGEDVKISVNFDVVDTEGNVVSNYVGWVNSSDVKIKSKVLN